jgi:hypothetical protein
VGRRRRSRGRRSACDLVLRWRQCRRRGPPRRPRPVDHPGRAAEHPGRPEAVDGGAAVGRQRLRADLRRLPAARRSCRRPARQAPRLRRRAGDVRRDVAGLRPGAVVGAAGRRARAAGRRRRAHRAGRGVDHRHDVRRGPGAQSGTRRVRGERVGRVQRRAGPRRRSHRRAQLALDLPGQGAGRGTGGSPVAARRRRGAHAVGAALLRRRGRAHERRWPAAPCVRDHPARAANGGGGRPRRRRRGRGRAPRRVRAQRAPHQRPLAASGHLPVANTARVRPRVADRPRRAVRLRLRDHPLHAGRAGPLGAGHRTGAAAGRGALGARVALRGAVAGREDRAADGRDRRHGAGPDPAMYVDALHVGAVVGAALPVLGAAVALVGLRAVPR